MSELDPRALDAAARALIDHDPSISGHHPIHIEYKLPIARAAVTAYIAEAGDGRLSELERENAALREALKPFIRECRSWDDDAPDDTEVWCSQGPGWEPIQSYFTLGDLRRAAALAGSGEK